jgi:hypothetical protein
VFHLKCDPNYCISRPFLKTRSTFPRSQESAKGHCPDKPRPQPTTLFIFLLNHLNIVRRHKAKPSKGSVVFDQGSVNTPPSSHTPLPPNSLSSDHHNHICWRSQKKKRVIIIQNYLLLLPLSLISKYFVPGIY